LRLGSPSGDLYFGQAGVVGEHAPEALQNFRTAVSKQSLSPGAQMVQDWPHTLPPQGS
jgi:hypothetical protein